MSPWIGYNPRKTKSLSQKGSDPLEAKSNLTLFCCQSGEGLTPFGIGSNLLVDMNRLLIFIATYNEIDNLPILVEQLSQRFPAAALLVIDDNSPDGTGRWCDSYAAQHKRFRVIHRAKKSGLGTAIKQGLQCALDGDYDWVATLDADLSHSPDDLLAMWKFLQTPSGEEVDVCIGSRYVAGGRIEGWPWYRRWASRRVNRVVPWLLGLDVSDCSGALRIYRCSALQKIDFTDLRCAGYAFLEELLFFLKRAGSRFVEHPIIFRDRQRGRSKLGLSDTLGLLSQVFRLMRQKK
jgi:dolichol-phosphate mannosyltransferase